ncbi:Maltose excess protein 1-like, chloroplastic [Sesamum angolense]|uniref:Maltose excess protein 1-like, chloroplastic n=1 Tax=Sesamum angolense TaxID=2727404 RepID=A0AAE2BMP8_9LAMI|nr:Maltose excess protein 1-like, chloroplastic [Sesamum angolense]
MAGSLLLMDKVRLRSLRPSDYCAFSSYPKSLKSFSCPQPHLESIFTKKLHLKRIIFSGQSICCYRLKPLYACSSEDAQPINQESVHVRGKGLEQWDSLTAKFAGAANVPFLLLQLPQIVLNTRNLLAGNKSALLAVPWLVMWSTFVPYIPNTVFPGLIAFVTAVLAVLTARMGKHSEKGIKILGILSGWTATLLFMWMPVAQLWTNLLNPEYIKGLSAVTMLLAMVGNGLLIPRALFIRDLMWFTGSTWACVFYGWGNLVCLYCFNSISREFFLASTLAFIAWIGMTFWRDAQVHDHGSPLTSLKELLFGR